MSVNQQTYPNGYVCWYKDGKWLFTQDFQNGYLDVDYDVWEVLRDEFGLNFYETQDILTNLLYDLRTMEN